MKVTVITVCLNSYATLKRNLDSVKSQNYKNIEQIIIDGCSTDGTHNIINNYKKHISKIIIQKDEGIYDAMNKGLLNSNGDIICFLNSDDFYASSNIISYVVKKMKDNDLDIFSGDVCYFRKDNQEKVLRRFSSKVFSPEKIKYGLSMAHPSVFIHKRIINKVGFFRKDYKIAGDFEYLLRIFKIKNIKYSYFPKVITYMQYGGVSTSGIKSYLLSNSEILRACKENGIRTNIFNICLRYIYKIKELIKK